MGIKFDKFMSGPWGMAAEAGLGGLAAATAPSPYRYKPYDAASTPEQRKAGFSKATGFYGSMLDTNRPIVSSADIARSTAVPFARLHGSYEAGNQAINERAISRGEVGRGGGMAEAARAENLRAFLDAQRAMGTDIAGKVAMATPGWRLDAAQGLGSLIQAQDAMGFEDWQRQQESAAARQAFGAPWQRFLAGASAAVSGGAGGRGGIGGGRQRFQTQYAGSRPFDDSGYWDSEVFATPRNRLNMGGG